jgi:hypothetical protein
VPVEHPQKLFLVVSSKVKSIVHYVQSLFNLLTSVMVGSIFLCTELLVAALPFLFAIKYQL